VPIEEEEEEEEEDATITISLISNDQLNMFQAIFCPKHVELIVGDQ
jgi:hypothetical protein